MERKPKNMFKFAGRIERMQYVKAKKELSVVLGIYRPNTRNKETLLRDYPKVIIEGDYAEKLRNELKVRDYKTFTGYLDLVEDMIPVGRNLYNRTTITVPYATQVTDSDGKDFEDIVVVGGIVTHVYRRPEENKKFYLITVETDIAERVAGKRIPRVEVIYFNPPMTFEPKEGDYVLATGTYRIRSEKVSGMTAYRNLTSVVANHMSIARVKEDPLPEEENMREIKKHSSINDSSTSLPGISVSSADFSDAILESEEREEEAVLDDIPEGYLPDDV